MFKKNVTIINVGKWMSSLQSLYNGWHCKYICAQVILRVSRPGTGDLTTRLIRYIVSPPPLCNCKKQPVEMAHLRLEALQCHLFTDNHQKNAVIACSTFPHHFFRDRKTFWLDKTHKPNIYCSSNSQNPARQHTFALRTYTFATCVTHFRGIRWAQNKAHFIES